MFPGLETLFLQRRATEDPVQNKFLVDKKKKSVVVNGHQMETLLLLFSFRYYIQRQWQLGGVFFSLFTKKGPGVCALPGQPFPGLVLPVLAGAKCKPLELKEDCVCVCNPTARGSLGGRSHPDVLPFFFFFFFFRNISPPWGLFLGGLLRILDSRLVRYPGLGGVVNVGCFFFFFFFEKSTTWPSALGVHAFIAQIDVQTYNL